jgi:hypothetical protein
LPIIHPLLATNAFREQPHLARDTLFPPMQAQGLSPMPANHKLRVSRSWSDISARMLHSAFHYSTFSILMQSTNIFAGTNPPIQISNRKVQSSEQCNDSPDS